MYKIKRDSFVVIKILCLYKINPYNWSRNWRL